MSSATPRPTPLQLWLGLLAALASLAALQASLLPRWPRARPLPAAALTAALEKAGFAAERLPASPGAAQGQRSHELALSAVLAYRLADGSELRLVRGTARQRGNLQAALFARDSKHLRLKQRQLLPGPPPQARGSIGGRDARQTCWVHTPTPGGGFGVTAGQLMPLVDSQAAGRQAALLRVIGLQANRDYSCVLISLRAGNAAPLPADRFPALLRALPAALGETGRTAGSAGAGEAGASAPIP
ncbi:MAG: hypothetical protein ACKO6F_01300 [Cyanobium sp.]